MKRKRLLFLIPIAILILLCIRILVLKSLGKNHSTKINEKTCFDTVGIGVLYFSSKQNINIGSPIPNTNFKRVIVSPAVIYLLQLMMAVKTDFKRDNSKLINCVGPTETRPAAHFMYHTAKKDSNSEIKNGRLSTNRASLVFRAAGDHGDDTLCLPCDYLPYNVVEKYTVYDVITKSDCGQKLCCLKGQSDVLNLILRMIYEDSNLFVKPAYYSQNPPERLSWWKKRRYAAHLNMKHSAPKGKEQCMWTQEDTQNTAFVNDLVFKHNNLSITRGEEGGLYFVYSAVTFVVKKGQPVPRGYHQIVKRNPNLRDNNGREVEFILQMNKFGGSSATSNWYTSFLCGTVRLQSQELVSARAKTNEPTPFDKRKYSNYFGMFKL